jgi:hypothetical protein
MKFVLIALVLSAILGFVWLARRTAAARDAFIAGYRFPPEVGHAVARCYPHLNEYQVEEVIEQLRGYLGLCRRSRTLLAMPSQAVDVAWHALILSARHYQQFCQRAFGRFLHHTPASAMPNPTASNAALRRCWHLACRRAGIDPRRPTALPPLFALDAQLAIPDGFHYAPDCRKARAADGSTVVYCGSDLGSGGCSGGGGSGCSGGDGAGGGDGGGGCGGGGGD